MDGEGNAKRNGRILIWLKFYVCLGVVGSGASC